MDSVYTLVAIELKLFYSITSVRGADEKSNGTKVSVVVRFVFK